MESLEYCPLILQAEFAEKGIEGAGGIGYAWSRNVQLGIYTCVYILITPLPPAKKGSCKREAVS